MENKRSTLTPSLQANIDDLNLQGKPHQSKIHTKKGECTLNLEAVPTQEPLNSMPLITIFA